MRLANSQNFRFAVISNLNLQFGSISTSTSIPISTINDVRSTTLDPSQIDIDVSLSTSCECFKYELYRRYLDTQQERHAQSYCSKEANLYGPYTRVISFTLFQSNSTEELAWEKGEAKHWERALNENLERMRKYFPGWIMRVYSNLGENEFVCKLRCNNVDFFWCDIKNIPKYGDLSMVMEARSWSFLPLGDPTVDVFLARNLDSVLLARDAAAVQDWLKNTTKPFHAFRDHPFHADRVLGGLWGGRNNLLRRNNETELFRLHKMVVNQTYLTLQEKSKVADQTGFTSFFLPLLAEENLVVCYDAFYCDLWRNVTLTRPFPTERNGTEFLGDVVLWGESGFGEQLTECPLSCRPEYGKSWKLC
ncbi:hypothetical protein Ocin01_09201 [Orchesella cincta]|uniref:Uncharacterized protein n=1 Tax=Orchesella cincta TaxID=48709 RepID=A0A1D2MWP9_ORCCI|nr:hypothetical protein Ocin01_09201 [Orchesella cincta]